MLMINKILIELLIKLCKKTLLLNNENLKVYKLSTKLS